MADIAAFREEPAGLVEEHDKLEARAGVLEPPTLLEEWRPWAKRSEAAAERWEAMQAGAWRPHLDRLKEEHDAIAAAIGELAACREREEAWASLAAARREVLDRAKDEGVPPFFLDGWGAFAAEAQAFSERKELPEAAAALAARILKHDRECREARAAFAGFLKDAREHRRRWDILEDQCERRRRQRPDLSIADHEGYKPLSGFAKTLTETAEPFLRRAEPALAWRGFRRRMGRRRLHYGRTGAARPARATGRVPGCHGQAGQGARRRGGRQFAGLPP